MDHQLSPVADPAPTGDDKAAAERARRAANEVAWSSCGGYETTSGCPCWDATPYPCVPKRTFGYNPNLFAIFCCCFCLPTERQQQ